MTNIQSPHNYTNEDDIWRYFSAGNDDSYRAENIELFWQYSCSFLNQSKQYTYFTICNEAYRAHIMPKVNPENAVYTGKNWLKKKITVEKFVWYN